MRVEQFLTDSAKRFGDKIALVAGAKRLSFGELDAMSDRLACVLARQGGQRGDRVVIVMDNCWEAVAAIFGVLKAGGVFVPINPSTKADKLAFVLNNCRAKALITQERLFVTAAAACAAASCISFTVLAGGKEHTTGPGYLSFEEAVNSGAPLRGAHPGIDLDLAMLIYTSGSTGSPKGVMMTHQNVVAAATSIMSYLENTPDDIILNVLPIS